MKIKEGIFDFQPGSYLVTTVYDIIGEITFPTYIRTEEEYLRLLGKHKKVMFEYAHKMSEEDYKKYKELFLI